MNFDPHTFASGFPGVGLNGMNSLVSPGMFSPAVTSVILGALGVLLLWSIIWKGIALWCAARNHQKGWFIVFMIFNTAGILEILYYLFFRKNKNSTVTTTTVTHTTVASSPAAAPTTPAEISVPTPAPAATTGTEIPSLAPTPEHQ